MPGPSSPNITIAACRSSAALAGRTCGLGLCAGSSLGEPSFCGLRRSLPILRVASRFSSFALAIPKVSNSCSLPHLLLNLSVVFGLVARNTRITNKLDLPAEQISTVTTARYEHPDIAYHITNYTVITCSTYQYLLSISTPPVPPSPLLFSLSFPLHLLFPNIPG
jgi:hypothetical protein